MKKVRILFFAASLFLLTGCLTSVNGNSEQSSSTIPSYSDYLREFPAVKDETVYAFLSPTGEVESIEMVNRLENVLPGLYLDYGNYLKATNLTTIDTILKEDNVIKVPVFKKQANFYYQTRLSTLTQLPFTFELEYFRENLKLSPQEVKGETGNFKVLLKVRSNPNIADYFKYSFMAQIQVPISLINHQLISATKASQVLTGTTLTLAYMVMPGQDLNIEIELQSSKFSLDNILATVMYFDLSDLLDFDINGLMDNLSQLGDGLQTVAGGSDEISQGLDLLESYFEQFIDGAEVTEEGLAAFYEALNTLGEGIDTLSGHLQEIVTGLNLLSQEGVNLYNGFVTLRQGLWQFFDGIETVIRYIPALKDAVTQLKEGFLLFEEGLHAYVNGVKQLSEGLNAWNEGFLELKNNIPLIIEGSLALKDGIIQFKEGLQTYGENFSLIVNGMNELSEGLNTMSEEFNSSKNEFDQFPITSEKPSPISFASPLNQIPRSTQFVYQIKGI